MRALTEASLSIAEESRRVALAAQRDSDAMKKIAALTTVFLPGTYIAVSLKILLLHKYLRSTVIVSLQHDYV
jgi:hypothetical protein